MALHLAKYNGYLLGLGWFLKQKEHHQLNSDMTNFSIPPTHKVWIGKNELGSWECVWVVNYLLFFVV